MVKYTIYILGMMVLLTGCTTQIPSENHKLQVTGITSVPKIKPAISSYGAVSFQGKDYTYKKQYDLITMSRYLYLPKKQATNVSPQQKNSKLVLFFDSNTSKMSLVARKQLREKSYAHNTDAITHLKLVNQQLLSSIIYKPDAKHRYWEIDVTRGKNIQNCGYLEWQYSTKISLQKMDNLNGKQQLVHIRKNYITPLSRAMDKKRWLWECHE